VSKLTEEPVTEASVSQETAELVADIKVLIENARQEASTAINTALTLLYWSIGKKVNQDIGDHQRCSYGERAIVSASRNLERRFGRGYSEKNLRKMMQFAAVYPDKEVVTTLSRQLSWSHFLILLPLDKPQQRDFYAELCRTEKWTVRTLRQEINSMRYERTAI